MFCSNCGSGVADDARFCPACGTPTTNGRFASENNGYATQSQIGTVPSSRGLDFAPVPQQTACSQPVCAQSEYNQPQSPVVGQMMPNAQTVGQEVTLQPRRFDSPVNVNDLYRTPRGLCWIVSAVSAISLLLPSDDYYYDDSIGSLLLKILLFVLSIGGVYCANTVFKKGKPYYEVGKTFGFFRMSIEKQKSIARFIGGFAVVLSILLAIWLYNSFFSFGYSSRGKMIDLVFILGCCGLTSYIAIKSINIHEDIDYVTNDDLAEIMDMTIDERVMASYQNFDSSEPLELQLDELEGNPNLFVMTQRQIYFAFLTTTGWISNQFKLENITDIEVNWDYIHYKGGVSFMIQDGDELRKLNIDLSLLDNLAQYPILIVRQILNTFDAFKQGKYVELSTKKKRRRKVVNNDSAADGHISDSTNDTQEVAAWESVPQWNVSAEVRSIELSPDVYDGLKNAKSGMSKRAIEL